MSIVLWQIAAHVAITLIAVVTLALRIEHRITKIETDVSWIKQKVQWNFQKECINEENR